ncbi:MAG: glycosyltransferase family 2 protein [Candidatus Rifleibacteriota bacterium]
MAKEKTTENNPLISVCMPAYNHEKFVVEAVKSVLRLDYNNLEFILINDGSNDKTNERIKPILNICQASLKRFEYRNRPNKGLTPTLNEGLAWADGKYFMVVASDDILLPEKIKILLPILEKDSRISAAFGGYELIDEEGKVLKIQKGMDHWHSFEELIMQKYIPSGPAALLRRDAVQNVGGYDSNIKIEDWYMWLKLSDAGGKLRSLPVPVAKYRIHDSNTVFNFKYMHENRMKILEKYKGGKFYKTALSKEFFQTGLASIGHLSLSETFRFLRYARFLKRNEILRSMWKGFIQKMLVSYVYIRQKSLQMF